MFQRFAHRGTHYLLLIVVWAVLCFPNLGAASLWDIDEGNNSTCSRAMYESGDWVVPKFNNHLRFDKPALLYWLQVAAYRAFGVNEFAARLPSALAALVAVLATYELGRRAFNARAALLASVIAASTVGFCAAAHFANPDALLDACTAVTLAVFFIAYRRGGTWWSLLTGATTGLGVLAKGPVGLVLPVAVLLSFLTWERQWRRLSDWRVLTGVLTFLIVAAPWYVWVALETKGKWVEEFIYNHNLGRFGHTMEGHGGSIFYYVLMLNIGFMPWSIFLAMTVWNAVVELRSAPQTSDTTFKRSALCSFGAILRRFLPHFVRSAGGSVARPVMRLTGRVAQLPGVRIFGKVVALCCWSGYKMYKAIGLPVTRAVGKVITPYLPRPADNSTQTAVRFLVCWVGVYFVFFTVAGTKLPNYILPLYPAVAVLMARLLDRYRTRDHRLPAWSLRLSLVLLALVGVGLAVGLLAVGGALPLGLKRNHLLPGLELLAVAGLVPPVGAAVAWWYVRRDRRLAMVCVLGLTAVVFTGAIAAWAPLLADRSKAPRELVHLLPADQTSRDVRIGTYGYFQPSLVFYCQREVQTFDGEQQVQDFLDGPLPSYLILTAVQWEELRPKLHGRLHSLGSEYDLYEGREVVVIGNAAAIPDDTRTHAADGAVE